MTSTSQTERLDAQCVVVGDGPAGLAVATALALGGIDVVLTRAPAAADGHPPQPDPRTAALFPAALALLDQLGAWDTARAASAPLAGIRIVDATGGLLRAPEVLFRPGEIGWPQFGCNVPHDALVPALAAAASRAGARPHSTRAVAALELDADGATVVTAEGARIRAALVVAADGRNSVCRTAAGIAVRGWSYPQAALTTRFAHSRPHRGISTELHTPAGPCTTVPLPDLPRGLAASSLVWVERPHDAARLADLDERAFLAALEARLGGLLGALSQAGPRRTFQLSGQIAATMGRSRVALVGEAGHVIPPIGAQGLNLGLLDAAVLADCVADAAAGGHDIGGTAMLAAYAAARHGDIARRGSAVDMLNRTLISDVLPVSLARGLGLHLIAAVPALRRRLMREGLEPPRPWPRLMQGADVLMRTQTVPLRQRVAF